MIDKKGRAAVDNYTVVDDNPPNDITDYILSATNDQIDVFGFANTPSDLFSGDTITLVHVGVRFAGEGASANSGFVVRLKSAPGQTLLESDIITPSDTTWKTNQNAVPNSTPITALVKPEGGVWTKSALDTIEAGVRLSNSDTNDARVTAIWVFVEYVHASTDFTFTIDAIVLAQADKTFTIDGVVLAQTDKTFTIDAIVLVKVDKTFTIDGVVLAATTKTFTIDGIVFAENTKTFTIDGVVLAETTKTFSIDGIVLEQTTKTFTIDGIVLVEASKTFTIDGLVLAQTDKTFSIDGLVLAQTDKTFTIDGLVTAFGQITFTIDGIVFATNTKTFTIDGIILVETTKTFTIDGIVFAENTRTFTIDGIVKATKLLSVQNFVSEDMTSSPSGTLKNGAAFVSGSPDGHVRLTTAANGQNGQLEYDDTLPAHFNAQFDIWAGPGGGADAIWFYWGNSSTPTSESVDAGGYKVAFDEYTGDQSGNTIQLWFEGTQIAVESLSGIDLDDSTWRHVRIEVRGNTVRVFLDGVNELEYTDVDRTLGGTLYGWGARTGGLNNEHRIRASYVDQTFTIDAIVLAQTDKTFTIDGIVKEINTSTFTIDGIVLAQTTKTFTIDGIVLVQADKTFTIDGVILTQPTKTFTIDGLIFSQNTKAFTIDGIIALLKTFTIDGIISQTELVTFTIDGEIAIPRNVHIDRESTPGTLYENDETPNLAASNSPQDSLYGGSSEGGLYKGSGRNEI